MSGVTKTSIASISSREKPKDASEDASNPEVELDAVSDKNSKGTKASKRDKLFTKQERVKYEQLSVRINGLIWDWIDNTHHTSGMGKNEIIERAVAKFLPEKLMPKGLRSLLPPDYFEDED